MRNQSHRRVLRVFGLLLASAMLLCGVRSAMGQMFGQDPEIYQSPVSTRDLEKMKEIIGLDEAQYAAVQDLNGALANRFQEANAKLQDAMTAIREEFEETNDPSVWQEFGLMVQDFSKHRDVLRDAFFEDVKLLFSGDQMAKWPTFERFHRREHRLKSRGPFVISGQTVDIIRLMEDVELTSEQEQAIAPVLLQYERDMDRALVNLEKVEAELIEDSRDIGMDWLNNMDKLDELWSKGRDAAIRVRDVNLRYQQQIALSLAGAAQSEFEAEFNKGAYPTVYRQTTADKAFRTVEEIEGLTPEQLEQIRELKASYERDLQTVRSKWSESMRETETDMGFQDLMARFGPGGSQPDGQEQAQQELVDVTYERLRELLTEEQREALPSKARTGFTRPTFGEN